MNIDYRLIIFSAREMLTLSHVHLSPHSRYNRQNDTIEEYPIPEEFPENLSFLYERMLECDYGSLFIHGLSFGR